MTTIYGVFCSGGSYDDYFNNLVKCWSTSEAADRHVKQLIEERDLRKAASTLYNEFQTNWNKLNPLTISFPQQNNLPNWNGLRKNQITDQMRAEKDAIIQDNHVKRRVYGEQMTARYERMKADTSTHLAASGVSDTIIQELDVCPYSNIEVNYTAEAIELD